ncbi:MAG: hypothetical protein HY399_06895 [Elusimicrobia bacterium]|nr:hypothetical protein [Elusimicrobiota bacterium]
MIFFLENSASRTYGQKPSLGAGTSITLGSVGYARWSGTFDGEWQGRDLAPFFILDLSFDSYMRQFTVGGGAWKTVEPGLRVKGGLNLNFGRFKETKESGKSFTLEMGLERELEKPVVGGEYRLTSGKAGSSVYNHVSGQRLLDQIKIKNATTQDLETFTTHELSGYTNFPMGKNSLGLRLTLGLPSYSGTVLTETASYKFSVKQSLYITPAVSLEQGPTNGAYISLGVYHPF